MSKPQIYRLVSRMANGSFKTIETTDLSGYEITGTHDNPRTREILQGQPLIRGFLGPMYDGNDIVRYESREAYNALSQ